jgi:hypothetical protein
MRRLFLYLIVAVVVFGALRALRHHAEPHAPAPVRRHYGPGPHEDAARHQRELAAQAHRQAKEHAAEARRQAKEAVAEARRAMEEAKHDVHQAWHEVRDELDRAYREARDEIRQAYREVVAEHQGRRPVMPPPPPPPAAVPAREEADGLPVPIVPGTRVTEAEARPPVPARPAAHAAPPVPPTSVAQAAPAMTVATVAMAADDIKEFPGEICATKERAKADARRALQVKVAEWLAPDVPASWTPPAGLLEAMVLETRIDPHISQVEQEDGPLYIPVVKADFSPRRRAELVATYNRELVQHRLMTLGGSLGFVLICLAAISGYIRADEATKGYYTNRLRLLAAAGVGAAGVIVYRMVA